MRTRSSSLSLLSSLLHLWLLPSLSHQSITHITMLCKGNGLYVSGRTTANGLSAESAILTDLNMFLIRENDDGSVSLSAKTNGMWVRADSGTRSKLMAVQPNEGSENTPSTKFRLFQNSDGTISIRSDSTGKYVGCRNEGNWLVANMDFTNGPFERFYFDIVTVLSDTATARVPLQINAI